MTLGALGIHALSFRVDAALSIRRTAILCRAPPTHLAGPVLAVADREALARRAARDLHVVKTTAPHWT